MLAEADICIQDVLNGTARENHSAYPTVVRNHNGTPFLPDQLLDEGDTKPLEIEQLNFCFHLMLGKASPKMLEVYRFPVSYTHLDVYKRQLQAHPMLRNALLFPQLCDAVTHKRFIAAVIVHDPLPPISTYYFNIRERRGFALKSSTFASHNE